MKRFLPAVLLGTTLALSAQTAIKPIPKEAFAAKTVAIVNNTHQEGIVDGATDAIKRWGHLTLVDDTDAADITLTFDKKSEYTKTSSQKTSEDGKPESSFGVTFSSAVHMHASLKGAPTAFYSTVSDSSKKKAGEACILDLQHAFLDNR
jgi:hypothetical protein